MISSTNTINVPKVIYFDDEVLVLEFIERKNKQKVIQILVTVLLNYIIIHQIIWIDYDNYIGSLLQSNKFHYNWNDFFIYQRLKPQLDIGNFTVKTHKLFDILF